MSANQRAAEDEPVRTWNDAVADIPELLRADADLLVKWVTIRGGEPMHALSRLLRLLPGATLAEFDRLRAELAETRAAGDAVLALHKPVDGGTPVSPVKLCGHCINGVEESYEYPCPTVQAWRSVRGDAPAPAEPPADAAMLPRLAPHLPHRGSDVATWLRAHRERHALMTEAWATIDDLLDDYRLHADTGTPLTEASGTGVPEETCGCGTTTATEKPPAVELPVTLSSVDDVAAEARTYARAQDPSEFDSAQDRVEQAYEDGYRAAAAAIEAARGGSR